jgi:1,4-dihydroxy-2-naphthoyl-CoA hydrolase
VQPRSLLARRCRSLPTVQEDSVGSDGSAGGDRPAPAAVPAEGVARQRRVGAIDGVTEFMGMRWEDPQTVRLRIRPELINAGGLLSGVATYALVDYCMGSTLWVETTREEQIATINIAVNYIQTAVDGEIVCRSTLDRRNRRIAVMRSEVTHEDGRLLVTAIGSYSIFPPRRRDGDGRAAPSS